MERKKKIALLVLTALFASAVVSWSMGFIGPGRDDILTIYGNVDIRTVHLSLRVGGRLAALHVDEGDIVTTGQVLGELDREPYAIAVNQAGADAAAQKAQLSLLEAGYREEEVAQVRAELRDRQVAFDYANTFLQRQQRLWSTRAVSADDLDNARTSRNQAAAAQQAARDKLDQYETGYRSQDIETGRAKLAQAEAALSKAQLDLADTQLTSPANGTVLTRAVEPGTMLAAGSTVLTLSLTRPVWVRAYVDGINLAQAMPGRDVAVYIDARLDAPYTGRIGFVSPTAEFTPKSVQTPELRTDLVYRLRIIITDPDDTLRQGMPVTVVFPAQ